MTIERYPRSRFWAVYDADREMICLCVYKKGAAEVVRRLAALEQQLAAAQAKLPDLPEFGPTEGLGMNVKIVDMSLYRSYL